MKKAEVQEACLNGIIAAIGHENQDQLIALEIGLAFEFGALDALLNEMESSNEADT